LSVSVPRVRSWKVRVDRVVVGRSIVGVRV
jgi:hypothetical protein